MLAAACWGGVGGVIPQFASFHLYTGGLGPVLVPEVYVLNLLGRALLFVCCHCRPLGALRCHGSSAPLHLNT